MKTSVRTYSIVSLALVFCAFAVPARAQTVKPIDTITIAELRDHIFYLASDDLEGRYTGSMGYEIAAKYCASQFAAAGLQPIITDGNGDPTWLQTVPMANRTVNGPPTMELTAKTGFWRFTSGEDFKIVEGEMSGALGSQLEVVFIGYAISEPDHGWDDFSALDVEGKVVIMTIDAPLRNGRPVLPDEVHEKYMGLDGFNTKLMTLIEHRPACVLVVADEQILQLWEQMTDVTTRTGMVYSGDGGSLMIPPIAVIKPEMARLFFAEQAYDPTGERAGNLRAYECFDLDEVTLLTSVDMSDEVVLSWNVVGMIEGTDPELKHQFVTVTAHLDHLEPRNGEVMNGADDNASGCAGVIEIAEALAMAPPRRSVVFALFTKEEGGGIGSRHFVSECPVPIDDVVVNLNLDMIGRTDAESESDRSHYALNSETENPEMTDIIRAVNARTINWPLKYNMASGGYGSDDTMFRMEGIPAVFFFSGPHGDYHQSTDDPHLIEYDKAQKISQLVYELALEFGNMDRSIRP